MKSHRDHKYRCDAPRAGRRKAERRKLPTLLTELRRSRPGDPELVVPMLMLTSLPVGTRLWIQVLHGAIWLNKKPIGPSGPRGPHGLRQARRVSRRLRRGPLVRVLRCCRKKGRCEFKLKPLTARRGKGVEP